MDILPNGTRVRISDVESFYWSEHGFIADSFDLREHGGKLAYTVRIPRDQGSVSLAATTEQFEVVTDAEMAKIVEHAAEMHAAAKSIEEGFGI